MKISSLFIYLFVSLVVWFSSVDSIALTNVNQDNSKNTITDEDRRGISLEKEENKDDGKFRRGLPSADTSATQKQQRFLTPAVYDNHHSFVTGHGSAKPHDYYGGGSPAIYGGHTIGHTGLSAYGGGGHHGGHTDISAYGGIGGGGGGGIGGGHGGYITSHAVGGDLNGLTGSGHSYYGSTGSGYGHGGGHKYKDNYPSFGLGVSGSGGHHGGGSGYGGGYGGSGHGGHGGVGGGHGGHGGVGGGHSLFGGYGHSHLKGLLIPIAGIALLGAAAAFASNPVLLQLGVVNGRRRKREVNQEEYNKFKSIYSHIQKDALV